MLGDYVFQNDTIAQGKKTPTWRGSRICALHCFIWTVCVLLTTGWITQSPWIWLVVFMSHWVLDRYNFIKWYMKVMGIFTYPMALPTPTDEKTQTERHHRPPGYALPPVYTDSTMVMHEGVMLARWLNRGRWIDVAIIDNTIHIFFLFLIAKFLIKG